jgi:hypothetical protein
MAADFTWSRDMRKALPTMVFAMACLALPARADQYAYVTVQQAAQAMQVLVRNPVVHGFCAPCGDQASQPVRVERVEIGRIWEGRSAEPYQASDGTTYWQVYLNDTPVDLAYLYVDDGEGWENLALQLGLPASDVPRRLDAAQTGR